MTAVQWWCSGVVLNRVFQSPRGSQGGQNVATVPQKAAGNQGNTGNSPPQPTSPDTGKAMDLAA